MGAVSKQLRDTFGGPGANNSNHLKVIDAQIPTNNIPGEYYFQMENTGEDDVYFSLMQNEEQIKYDNVHAGVTFAETATFKCKTQHPNGLRGTRDALKEAHLLAPAFSYDVASDDHTDQFNADAFFVTVKDGKTLVVKDLGADVTNGRTGNTQTKFIRIVEAPVTLTRCSDFVICIKAGRSANITFLVSGVTRKTK